MGWHQVINDYTENYLIEQFAISLFYELGWETDFYDKFSKNNTLGHDATGKFVLRRRVHAILVGQNPDLLPKAIGHTVEELIYDLLSPKLISGEMDMENIEVRMPNNISGIA